MNLLEMWMDETTCSAVPAQVKEMACYLTIAAVCQAQQRTFKYLNPAGVEFDLGHVKVLSLSCILSGKPGSYKSETIRFMKRIMEETGIIFLYPHDQVTREFLLSTLVQEQQQKQLPAVISTVMVDELVNFLNKKEYVEPLIGTLNALLDQPPAYAVGTHKRGTETLLKPIVNMYAACAPAWFKFLPEALFTGGFAGRCMFYDVPYPSDDERQPRGKVCHAGAEKRLAAALLNMPNGYLKLTNKAINQYDVWEQEWGKEDMHPLPVLDEWFKRRAIQTVRLGGAVSLANGTNMVDEDHLLEANKHLEHVKKTLEKVWFEVDSDASTAHQMLKINLATYGQKGLPLRDIENMAVRHLRNPAYAQRVLSWWIEHQILVPVQGGNYKMAV